MSNNLTFTCPRMRTIPEAYAELKRSDPDTAYTLSALRRAVKRGEIPVLTVGNKRLINLDKLFEYLYTDRENEKMNKQEMKTICKIS